MSDDGVKSAGRDDFKFLIHVASFELLKQDASGRYILSLSERKPHHRTETAYTFPPTLLEELARHILRTVAPTTEERMLSALNRIEMLLKPRE